MGQGAGLRAQLVRAGIGSITVKIAATGLSFGSAVLLARVLGPEGYGLYAYVFALISLLAIPAQFGLPNLVVRETAKAQAQGDWALMKGIWKWAGISAVIFSAVLAGIGGGIAWISRDAFTEVQLGTFAWGLLLVPLIALGDLRGAALRGLRRVVPGLLPEGVIRPSLFIVCVTAALFAWPSEDFLASQAMALHAAAAAGAFVIGAIFLYQARPPELISSPEPARMLPVWKVAALQLALVSGMQVVNQQIGIITLGFFAPSSDVGLYKVAMVGGSLVVFGLTAINLVVSPHFSRLHAQQDRASLQHMVTWSAQVSLLIAAPIALGFVVWGGDFLQIGFGDSYANAYTALVIISLGQILNAAFGPVGFLLMMTGHERQTARGIATAAVANVVLCLMLIPTYGMNGAAVAMAITLAIWNVLLSISAQRKVGIISHAFRLNRQAQ